MSSFGSAASPPAAATGASRITTTSTPTPSAPKMGNTPNKAKPSPASVDLPGFAPAAAPPADEDVTGGMAAATALALAGATAAGRRKEDVDVGGGSGGGGGDEPRKKPKAPPVPVLKKSSVVAYKEVQQKTTETKISGWYTGKADKAKVTMPVKKPAPPPPPPPPPPPGAEDKAGEDKKRPWQPVASAGSYARAEETTDSLVAKPPPTAAAAAVAKEAAADSASANPLAAAVAVAAKAVALDSPPKEDSALDQAFAEVVSEVLTDAEATKKSPPDSEEAPPVAAPDSPVHRKRRMAFKTVKRSAVPKRARKMPVNREAPKPKKEKVSPKKKKAAPKATPKKKAARKTKHASPKGGNKPIELYCGPPKKQMEGIDWTGWTEKIFQRTGGETKGQTDSYWFSPEKQHRFRSYAEIKRFLAHMADCNNDEEEAYRRFKGKK